MKIHFDGNEVRKAETIVQGAWRDLLFSGVEYDWSTVTVPVSSDGRCYGQLEEYCY